MDNYQWQAHIEWNDFGRSEKLYLFQHQVSGAVTVISGFTEGGEAIMKTIPEGVKMNATNAPSFPVGALAAIATELGSGSKIDYLTGQLKIMQASLDVERKRVDDLTNKLLKFATDGS